MAPCAVDASLRVVAAFGGVCGVARGGGGGRTGACGCSHTTCVCARTHTARVRARVHTLVCARALSRAASQAHAICTDPAAMRGLCALSPQCRIHPLGTSFVVRPTPELQAHTGAFAVRHGSAGPPARARPAPPTHASPSLRPIRQSNEPGWLAGFSQAQCMHCANLFSPCWKSMGSSGICQQHFLNQAVM